MRGTISSVGVLLCGAAVAAGCSIDTATGDDVDGDDRGVQTAAHHTQVLKAKVEKLQLKGDPFLHRTGHQVAAVKNDLFIFRGVEDDIATAKNTFRDDLFRLDPKHGERARMKEMRERGDVIPPETGFHCMVSDSRRSLFSFGGAHYLFQGDPAFFQSFVVYDTLWKYDVSDKHWQAIQPLGTKPAPRAGCNAEFHDGSMYVFGGLNRFFALNNELWRFDTNTTSWTQLTPTGPVPEARFIGATTTDHDTGRIYLFNGHRSTPTGFQTIGDFWVYDVATNAFRALPSIPAPARDEGTLSLLRAPGGKKYLIHTAGHTATPVLCTGFIERTTAINEVWAFDLEAETWQQLQVEGDAPRLEFVRGATIDNEHYLVGGYSDVPDPVNICRQQWNEDVYRLSLVNR
jgi:N-acetylneuraminic acid mutarotase